MALPVGYQSGQVPGTTDVLFDDGKSVRFTDNNPLLAEHKRRADMVSQQQSAMAGGPPDLSDVPDERLASAEPAPLPPAAQAGVNAYAQGMQELQQRATPPQGQPVSDQPEGGVPQQGYAQFGDIVFQDGVPIGKIVGPSAGRPAQFIPTSRSMEVTGAQPEDKQYLEESRRLDKEKGGVLKQAESTDQAEAQGIEKVYAEEEARTRALFQNDQQRLQSQEEQIAQFDAKASELAQEASAAEVDPGRLFRGGKGTIGLILAGIGGAMSSFGSAFSRGGMPNHAVALTQQAIQQDIRAQERQLLTKERSADNALKRYRDAVGDNQTGRALLEASMNRHLATRLRKVASGVRDERVAQQYMDAAIALDERAVQREHESRVRAMGVITQRTSEAFDPGKAASAGGLATLTFKEALGASSGVQGLQSGAANIEKTKVDTAKAAAEAAAGPKDSPLKETAKQTLRGLEADFNRIKDYQGKPDLQKSRTLPTRLMGQAADFALGEGTTEGLLSEEKRNENQDFLQAQDNLISTISVLNRQGVLRGKIDDVGTEAGRAVQAATAAGDWAGLQRAYQQSLIKGRALVGEE